MDETAKISDKKICRVKSVCVNILLTTILLKRNDVHNSATGCSS